MILLYFIPPVTNTIVIGALCTLGFWCICIIVENNTTSTWQACTETIKIQSGPLNCNFKKNTVPFEIQSVGIDVICWYFNFSGNGTVEREFYHYRNNKPGKVFNCNELRQVGFISLYWYLNCETCFRILELEALWVRGSFV